MPIDWLSAKAPAFALRGALWQAKTSVLSPK